MESPVIPPIPSQTYQQAKTAFGDAHPFLKIGDQLEDLLPSDGFAAAPSAKTPGADGHLRSLPCLALVSVLQFHEGMTDQQTSNAIRERIEWKYALHLPQWHFGIEESRLCAFRQMLYTSDPHYQMFLQIYQRIEQANLFPQETAPEQQYVLPTICIQTRLSWLSKAFSLALGALAAYDSEWLRRSSQPQWYFRYGKTGSLAQIPFSLKEKEDALLLVGKDAQELIEKANAAGLMEKLSPLQVLKEVFAQQLIWAEDAPLAFRPRCSFC